MDTKLAVRQKALWREEEQFANYCFLDYVESYTMILLFSVSLFLCCTVRSEHDVQE